MNRSRPPLRIARPCAEGNTPEIGPGDLPDRVFLTRTAVLERMCGPLCEAVLDLPGSAATLAALARSDLLLVPLDGQGQWYRYHRPFRDVLLAELERQTPDLIPGLRRGAAGWCLRNDLPEEALEYSIAAGDVEVAARLVEKLWLPVCRGKAGTRFCSGGSCGWTIGAGSRDTRWSRWRPRSSLRRRGGRPRPSGGPNRVDRWPDQDASRTYDPPSKAFAAVLRAVLCRRGVEQMLADADEAARRFAAQGIVIPAIALLQGIALVLSGDLGGGDAYLDAATGAGEQAGGTDVLAIALGERSLVAMAGGDWSRADVLAGQARAVLRRGRIEDSYATPLVCAVQARAFLHRGDVPAARQELVSAQRARPVLTYALPHLAVQARIELARARLALADLAGARTLMREIDDLLKRRPGLGTLVGEARTLQAELANERGSIVPGASALTAAELRLLPLLSTHLPLHEIAAELFLSPHTVRTQAKSIYRKLGASTRSQAVTLAHELGLLEGLGTGSFSPHSVDETRPGRRCNSARRRAETLWATR